MLEKKIHHKKKKSTNTHEPFSKRAQNTARWASLVVLWVIIGSIAIGKAGIANYRALLNERDTLFEAGVQLTVENQNIQKQIEQLKTSSYAQEKYLREEFGYLGKNQSILWLIRPQEDPYATSSL